MQPLPGPRATVIYQPTNNEAETFKIEGQGIA